MLATMVSACKTDFYRQPLLLYSAGLALIGLVIYANAVFNPFVHDDLTFIRHNPGIARLDGWAGFFTKVSPPAESALVGPGIVNPYYRPLLEILYRLQYRVFGFNAYAYHFFNIIIHIANTLLVFFILLYCLNLNLFTSNADSSAMPLVPGPPVLAWCSALLFLIHPVQTEAVACIAGVSNLVFSLFCLLSFLFYIKMRGRELKKQQRFLYFSGSLLCYLSALLCKEQAIFLPFWLLMFECLILMPARAGAGKIPSAINTGPKYFGWDRSAPWMNAGVFILVTLFYFLWRKMVIGSAVTAVFAYKEELFLRLAAIPKTLLMYLRILVAPYDLHYLRSIDVLEPAGGAWLFLALVVVGVWLLLRSLPAKIAALALFGLAWFMAALLPVLNIIPLIHEYSRIATFEHFLYLPCAGLAFFAVIAGGYFLSAISKGRMKIIGLTSMVLLGIVFGGLSVRQNSFWRGEIPLFERAVVYEPGLGRLRLLLGKAYYAAGRYDLSVRELKTALTIMQGYLTRARYSKAGEVYQYFIKEIYFVLAHDYERQGDYRLANEQYRLALLLDPRDADIHKNAGINFIRLGDPEQAAFHFRQAVLLNGQDVVSLNNLAVYFMGKKQLYQAEQLLRQVLSIDSSSVLARRNLDKLMQINLNLGGGHE